MDRSDSLKSKDVDADNEVEVQSKTVIPKVSALDNENFVVQSSLSVLPINEDGE